MTYLSALAFVVTWTLACQSQAALVEFDYNARVDEVEDLSGALTGIVTEGDILAGSFSYDSESAGILAFSFFDMIYQQSPPSSFQLALGSTLLSPPSFGVLVRDHFTLGLGADRFAVFGETADAVFGADTIRLTVDLLDESIMVFSDSSLPSDLDLAKFTSAIVTAQGRTSSLGLWSVTGQIESVELIPEPGHLGLLGLLGVLAGRWFARRSRC